MLIPSPRATRTSISRGVNRTGGTSGNGAKFDRCEGGPRTICLCDGYIDFAESLAPFLGVSQDDARATKGFASEYGVTFPLLLDPDGYAVSNAYGLTNVPTIFLIESGGKVKVSSTGFDKQDLETIASELAERRKIALAPLFRPDEVVPANKPG